MRNDRKVMRYTKMHGLGNDYLFVFSEVPANAAELSVKYSDRVSGIGSDGMIEGFHLRIKNTKLATVKAFQSIGYETIAVGDSYNDLDMLKASKTGILFRSTEAIIRDHPELPACETYDELMAAIKAAL